MTASFDERILALAGMAQALQQVRRTAETGQSNSAVAQVVLDSVFRIDAPSTIAVYGGEVKNLDSGLRVLNDYFNQRLEDGALRKLAVDVMQLERRFVVNQDVIDAVSDGIVAITPLMQTLGSTHPEVFSALGKLYADTISHMQPRIMIMGNPHYLSQADVASEVRAIMLAAIRSAVLWRQLGGSQWHFLFAKRAMAEAVEHYLH
ncbi:MAG: high frequency lysogenization protein HflD [Xanthomonadaceae bacterium]|jgi:high frequency lysogenization protein|nr:high frequency lysogenization protein HflD [Xanthomonadaceae bacterium]